MEIAPAWGFSVGFGPVEHRTAALVEDGPQYMSPRIPESWTVKSDGVPRAGYSRLPADYSYIELVKAIVQKHIGEDAPDPKGRIIDVLA